MRDSSGDVHLTPQWQNQVDTGTINWWGVANDLAWIIGSGVSVLGVWGAAVGSVIVGGTEAIREMQKRQEEQRERERAETEDRL